MLNDLKKGNSGPGAHGSGVIAKADSAGRTNNIQRSLVKCEVELDAGKWVSPESCQTYYIDEDGCFPTITYEIKTDADGPYQWSWDIKWNVMACPQRRDRTRFRPKKEKVFADKGEFSSESKKWVANLRGTVIGGELTVKVKAGNTTFIRKVIINGSEPGREKILGELARYSKTLPREVGLAKKIFQQESKFCNFYSDAQPLVSFDNGYGLGQATKPVPSYEQVWNWKKHIEYILTVVIKEKRELAKKYLDKHKGYTEDDLDMETLVHYNGANYHYLIWDKAGEKWKVNDLMLCDPKQSNTGWDMKESANHNKSLAQLREGEGGKPKYTGRCYAEHIKNSPGEK